MTRWGRPALADDFFDLCAHRFKRDVQRFKRLGGDAFSLMDEAEQDVLGADVRVVEQACLFLSQYHDPAGPIGKPFKHL